jgi:hypothetical protein
MFRDRECRKVAMRLWDRAAGRLPDVQRKQVEDHLAHCRKCRQEADSCAQTARMMKAYGEEVVAVPLPAWHEIENRLNMPRPPRPALAGYVRPAAWGGATLVVALFLWMILFAPHRRNILPPSAKNTLMRNDVVIQDKDIPPHKAPLSTPKLPSPHQPERYGKNLYPGPSDPKIPNVPNIRLDTPQFTNTPPPEKALVPDATYLDGRDTQLAAFWITGLKSPAPPGVDPPLPPVKEDFVRVPFPQIAGMDTRAIEAARRVYKQEAQIVDARLFRKVALHEKGTSLQDLCAKLEKQTGVKVSASRGIRDEKASVFVNQLPARDVMRAVARLFNGYWQRTGEEGAYEYALKQDFKSQIAEENLRNKDMDAALLALDEAIAVGPRNTPAVQAYLQLTPAERSALRAGKEIRFSTGEALPGGFPAGWAKSLLESFGTIGLPDGNFTPAETPGFEAAVTLSLVHSELGQLSLECQSSVHGPGLPGIASMKTLGTGRSPSSEKPDNRAANKGLEADPAFGGEVSLAPKPCGKPDFKTAFGVDFDKRIHIGDDLQNSVAPPTPHVNSADVWEAVHEKTGLPIIADYYTHLYPTDDFTVNKRPLFDALCRVADALGVHWKKDGDFLLCRSTSFFWDKIKEVPNRLLDRWQKDREANGGLPLDDLLEMTTLTDQQLDSLFVGQGVKHCRNIMEWNILSNPEYSGMRRKYDTVRPMARFLATLPNALRTQLLGKEGVLVSTLNPAIQEALSKIIPPYGKTATYEGMRFRVEYVPAGRYYWQVVVNSNEEMLKWLSNPPIVTGKTQEEAMTAARQVYGDVSPDDIRRSYGQLAMSFLFADGSSTSIGKGPPAVRIQQ